MLRALRCWMLFAAGMWLLSPVCLAADLVAETPEAAAADPDFALQGEYEAERLGVQVVAQGGGEFLIVKFPGGLPGAGGNVKERQVIDGDADAVRALIESLKLKKANRKSPTLGAAPPTGGVLLFDGTQKSLDEHWKPGTKLSPEGLLVPAATTKESFNDFSVHLEFRLPYMLKARGQGRANSGMYLHGRYEVQILDSFGLEGKNNECGGLYSVRDPDLNMCLPPLIWQTYDADFTAPRFDENGKRTSNARMTVRLNGVPVHQDIELTRLTPGNLLKDDASPGPLFLQDHLNPVRFRNIWIVKREADKEARRPIVPTFERLHASATPASAEGGFVLLSELGCVNCHASEEPGLKMTGAKSGPILDDVGQRARGDWLARFLASPHAVKPGTTMPAVLEHLPEAERDHAVKALTSYLVGKIGPVERNGDRAAAKRGSQLFHSIGCVACHAPRKEDAPHVNRAATVPLPVVGEKYPVVALEKFLKDPLAVRPSGRMPSLNLNDKEARDLACYLVSDSNRSARPNINYTVYHGLWENPPDFSQLKPVKTGTCEGFDISVDREDAVGIVFEGYWNVEVEAPYTFFLSSDDGSKLYVDDELIARYGGPFTKVPPRVLTKGVHKIRVEYVEAWGEQNLTLEVQGRGILRQPIESWLRLTPEDAANRPLTPTTDGGFVADASLAAEGKALFSSLGCAACHRKAEEGKALASTLTAKPLKEVNPVRGCLAESPGEKTSAPQFDLSPTQKAAITAALAALSSNGPVKRDLITTTMASFNCYACHKRDGLGGPERDRDPLFLTTQHEMGDEGRVPPPLDGVGDKLQPGWLKKIVNDGAKDRPYMLTRMPRFGAAPVDQLVKAFTQADQHASAGKPPEREEAEHRTKAVGRKLAGNNAFGCVKCHVFGGIRSSGIQAIDLLTMTRRVREDWFYRYLVNPQAYRPGTRMPTAFVDGKSVVRDVYDADPPQQMKALWAFLSDGEKAAVPDGLIAQAIELVPTSTPIIYRNFLDGLTSRGIAVGYPEQADLAWDAEKMSLAALWHGKFVDASRHWTGRGADKISPLGDHVIRPEMTTPVAVLASQDTPWPSEPPRTLGYRFKGYELDEKQRPAFRYTVPAGEKVVSVTDAPVPATDLGKAGEPGMRRTITLSADSGVNNVYVRIARGTITSPDSKGGAYSVDGEWKVRIKSTPNATPVVRGSGKEQELLVPVAFEKGKAIVELEIVW